MQVNEQYVFFSSSDALVVVNGAAAVAGAPVAGTAWVTLDLGSTADMAVAAADRRRKLVFESVMVQRATGASGTAHTELLADVTGSVSTAWATKHVGAAVAAGTRTDTKGHNRPIYTATSGKLFFTPGGDAADTFDYFLAFRWVL